MRVLPSLLLAFGLTLVVVETADAAGSKGPGVLSRARDSFGRTANRAANSTRDAARNVGNRARNEGRGADKQIGIKYEGKFDGVWAPSVGGITGTGNDRRGCEGKAGILSGSANVTIGASRDGTGGRQDNKASGRTRPTGSKCGVVGKGSGVGVEGSVINLNGECATAAGTVGGKVVGAGVSGGINPCEIEAKADLIYGEVSYETPSVGGCGVEGSVAVQAGLGVGVGLGVGRVGTVGGKGRVGPVKLGAGVNLKVDGKGVADCAGRAWSWLAGKFKGVPQAVGQAYVNQAKYGAYFFQP